MAINFLSVGNSTFVSKKGGKISRQFFDLITFWQGKSNFPFRTSKQYSTFENAGIYVYDYPHAKELNPIIHRIILEKAETPDMGATMTDWKCRNIKEFRLIGDYVLNLQSDFCISSFSLKMMDLWGQVYNEGDYQEYHYHPASYFSAVFFFTNPENSGNLVFRSPLEPDMLPLKNGQMNDFSWRNCFYNPPAASLIIFRSSLMHMVERCKNKTPRITGAFNFV